MSVTSRTALRSRGARFPNDGVTCLSRSEWLNSFRRGEAIRHLASVLPFLAGASSGETSVFWLGRTHQPVIEPTDNICRRSTRCHG